MGRVGRGCDGAPQGAEAVRSKDGSRKPGQEGTRVTWVRDDSGSEQDASRGGAKRRFRSGVFGR